MKDITSPQGSILNGSEMFVKHGSFKTYRQFSEAGGNQYS